MVVDNSCICNEQRSMRHRDNPGIQYGAALLNGRRELDNLTKPVVTEGAVRYKVLGACVHTSEVVKK